MYNFKNNLSIMEETIDNIVDRRRELEYELSRAESLEDFEEVERIECSIRNLGYTENQIVNSMEDGRD